MTGWRPGDRVEVCLPVRVRVYSKKTWVGGTVREVDPPGLPPGVHVDLDREVNGTRTCFATHAELRVEGA